MTTQHLASEMIQIKSIFSPLGQSVPIWVSIHTSLCLLLSSPFSLSPSSEMTLLTQVSMIIIRSLTSDSDMLQPSGDAKLQLPQGLSSLPQLGGAQGLPPFLQQLAQASQASQASQLPPFLQALSGSSGQQQLPFVPPFLSGAGSGSTPSFLPPWLQGFYLELSTYLYLYIYVSGLAGSLPATGRADTAAAEGTEEINVAAKEEELNNAMVNN